MTIKYKQLYMLPYGWGRVFFLKKKNFEVGSPYEGLGSDLFRQGTFQPKGEQNSLLVCPT